MEDTPDTQPEVPAAAPPEEILPVTFEHIIGQKELECVQLRMALQQAQGRINGLEQEVAALRASTNGHTHDDGNRAQRRAATSGKRA